MDKPFIDMQAAIAAVQTKYQLDHSEVADMLETIRFAYVAGVDLEEFDDE